MKFTDRAQIGGMKVTQDGYLVGDVRCSRTGIQQYLGVELGLPTSDVINVYRPESEVFSKDSLASYANKPISDDHPVEMITSDNWAKYGKGDIGSDIVRDGEFVSVSYKIMDGDTIAKVKAGKAEVSMGYMAEIDFQDGVTPDGQAYQAIQKNIRINHLAIVDRGRAGSECGFSDNAIVNNWGTSPITKVGDNQVTLKTLIVDGLTVETTDTGAVAVQKLADDKNTVVRQLADAKAAHETAINAKDAELATKDAEIDALKAAKLSDAEIDAKVQARSDLLSKAHMVAKDADFTGLSDAEIKKSAVVAVLGDAAIADKAEAYIDARFDILCDDAKVNANADPFQRGMNDKKTIVTDNGQAEYEQRQLNAWKGA